MRSDQTITYYGMDTTLIEEDKINLDYVYSSSDFHHFEILDTVDGNWTDFGFNLDPFGNDKAIKVVLSNQVISHTQIGS